MDEDTTALFGLPGFRVRHVYRDQFGASTVHVQTDDETAAGCPSCGVLSSSVKGKVSTAPRDLLYGDGLISIVWHKRRWRCVEPLCARLSFTESVPGVPPRSRTTGRLRRAAGSAVADACRSVAEVAQRSGCRGRVQTIRLRLPQPRQRPPPNTLDLPPETPGGNSNLKNVARLSSKSHYIAAAVRYLVSPAAAMIHGTVLDVDGGISTTRLG